MQRSTRIVIANVGIVAASLVGAFEITQILNPSASIPTASASQPSTSATPSSSASPSASAAPPSNKKTGTGAAVNYRYGTIQVEAISKSGKLTAVNLLQAGATAGRDAAFSALISAAISANGSNFGNASGATFTTQAFKQALDSAIANLK
jgi:uncharacterized protein with FMN-binding domain